VLKSIQKYIKDGEVDFDNVSVLITCLETAFGDLDKKGTAQRALTQLYQKNSSFTDYLVYFNRLVQSTGSPLRGDWDEYSVSRDWGNQDELREAFGNDVSTPC
jgi:hypothetical protein